VVYKEARKGTGSAHAVRNESWKLAYADFMTALMALFSVLWLLSSSPETRQTIGGYFHGSHSRRAAAPQPRPAADQPADPAPNEMERLQRHLENAFLANPELRALQQHVAMSVTRQGLRVELLEQNRVALFETGRDDPTDAGDTLLKGIARELGKVPNRIALEGHTDSAPFPGPRNYSNWELSIDRANAARRVMSANGLWPGQVSEVFGSADRNPGTLSDSRDAANRRVTVIVQYSTSSRT
jgi:chemotaxis protein MotB